MNTCQDVMVEILVVSQDMPLTEAGLIDEVLAHHGAGAHRVNSYKRAIEAIIKRKYAIAVLYSSFRKDDFTIAEAVRLMKEIVPSLSIIAISKDTPLETERELRESGLYFHLTVPFEKSEFEDVLAGAIDRNYRGKSDGRI